MAEPASSGSATAELVAKLQSLSAPRAPFTIYTLMLHNLFSNSAEDLDEDRAVNSATGIRDTVVWNGCTSSSRPKAACLATTYASVKPQRSSAAGRISMP